MQFIRNVISVLLLLLLLVNSIAPTALAATTTYTYDPNGNMTSDTQNCYVYNEANQLSQVKNCATGQLIAVYVYDYQGNRIEKKNYQNGQLISTVYSPEDEYETDKIASTGATQNTSYYFANDQLIAKKNPDGSKNYYSNDHLGSASVVTDQSGNVVEQTAYDPWGNVTTGGTVGKYQYTGQEKDSETGLDYYNARYYDPAIQHFTQADTVSQNLYDPQQLNKYSYVRNNPLIYTDPSGHFIQILAAAALVGLASFDIGYLANAGKYVILDNHPGSTFDNDPELRKTALQGGIDGLKLAPLIMGSEVLAPAYIESLGLSENAALLAKLGVKMTGGGLTAGTAQAIDNYNNSQPLWKNVFTSGLIGVGLGGFSFTGEIMTASEQPAKTAISSGIEKKADEIGQGALTSPATDLGKAYISKVVTDAFSPLKPVKLPTDRNIPINPNIFNNNFNPNELRIY